LRQFTRLSSWTTLNVLGLVVAAAGMLVQISAGSDLYPSMTGPIVLVVTALLVVVGPSRWTRWIGLGVPLVLGIGAGVAAAMTGDFIDQLTGTGNVPLLLGSWMHVIGLIGAVIGAVAAMLAPREAATVER
jgi:hypothetical protein